jgi:hypothetical protein
MSGYDEGYAKITSDEAFTPRRTQKEKIQFYNFRVGETRELIVKCLQCQTLSHFEVENVFMPGERVFSKKTLPADMFEVPKESRQTRLVPIIGLVIGVIFGMICLSIYGLGKMYGFW